MFLEGSRPFGNRTLQYLPLKAKPSRSYDPWEDLRRDPSFHLYKVQAGSEFCLSFLLLTATFPPIKKSDGRQLGHTAQVANG